MKSMSWRSATWSYWCARRSVDGSAAAPPDTHLLPSPGQLQVLPPVDVQRMHGHLPVQAARPLLLESVSGLRPCLHPALAQHSDLDRPSMQDDR